MESKGFLKVRYKFTWQRMGPGSK